MLMWQCIACGTSFDPQGGDPLGDLDPGKGKAGVPEDMTCPNCGVTGEEKFKEADTDSCC